MKIAVVGATGLVGSVLLKVLEESKYLPLEVIDEIIPVASERSKGKTVDFNNKRYAVVSPREALSLKPEVAIFSAGAEVSREFAPQFSSGGTFVIDNSSAWRMDPNVPLVVPEVNGHVVNAGTRIIANPNCSTIQLVMAMHPLHEKYGIRRLVIATYQSVTGTGNKGVTQLQNERQGISGVRAYPHSIDLNLFPHGGSFESNGSTTEETKLLNETRKILNDDTIGITSTVVRVPVMGGHSEAVNIELKQSFETEDIYKLYKHLKGIVIQDDVDKSVYPMPKHAEGRDEVFIGRIRRDGSVENGLNMWIVADNLRKGAATNAVQIAALLHQKEIL